MDARWRPATSSLPANEQDMRGFYVENVPTQKIPVHSRDAACPRPVCMCVLRSCVRPACGYVFPCPRPVHLHTQPAFHLTLVGRYRPYAITAIVRSATKNRHIQTKKGIC